ncbi:MAG: hypothetical protein HYV07_05390 [Deltaproteobacteria bacterium]|nr:hypothetical protein [Deltaproteobacteria bacterium]
MTCEEIVDEAACHQRPDCEALYFDCASGGAAEPIGDGDRIASPPCDPGFGACQTRRPPDHCEGLDEASCLANPRCAPDYGATRCAGTGADDAMPCREGEDCGRCGESGYMGCHLIDHGCECEPVTCEMYCEFGFARDDRGCEVCACTPPPVGDCSLLSEEQCLVTPGCEPVYDAGGACACPDCAPGEACPPCDCNSTRPIAPQFAYCANVREDKCEWLDEAACNAEPSCTAEYLWPPCACDATDPENCGVSCQPVFAGCHSGNTTCGGVMCDMYCEFGFQIDPNGCEICACNPPPSGCWGLDEQSCSANPSCEPMYGETGCACPVCDNATGAPCMPCDCGPSERFYAGCADVAPCAAVLCAPGTVCQACPPNADCSVQCVPVDDRCVNLDEASCNATPECEAEYAQSRCLVAPCIPDASGNCEPAPPCGTSEFMGCHLRTDQCPPIPAIWCPYGNVIDPATGCATGECAPNPECAGLTERECISRADCSAVYGQTDCLRPCADGDPSCDCGTQFMECR